MSAIEPEDRLRLLRALSRRFSTPDAWIDVNLTWENEFGRAGIYTNDQSASVFLNNAQIQVADIADAEAVLRGIFADEIVSVTVYEKENFVLCELAPVADLRVNDNLMAGEHSRSRVIETWSKGMLKHE